MNHSEEMVIISTGDWKLWKFILTFVFDFNFFKSSKLNSNSQSLRISVEDNDIFMKGTRNELGAERSWARARRPKQFSKFHRRHPWKIGLNYLKPILAGLEIGSGQGTLTRGRITKWFDLLSLQDLLVWNQLHLST